MSAAEPSPIAVPADSPLARCLKQCLERSDRTGAGASGDAGGDVTTRYARPGVPVECPAVCEILADAAGTSDAPSALRGQPPAAAWHKDAAASVWLASAERSVAEKLLEGIGGEPDITLAGVCAPQPARLVESLRSHKPDVLLLDGAAACARDARLLRRVRRLAPRSRVPLLVEEPGSRLVEEILRHRLHGYVQLRCPAELMLRAIRAVMRGDIWVPRVLLAKALSNVLAQLGDGGALPGLAPSASGGAGCTSREREILELVRRGRTNKEIARELGIMEDTVKKHLQHVYTKLGVRRRALLIVNQPRAGMVHV